MRHSTGNQINATTKDSLSPNHPPKPSLNPLTNNTKTLLAEPRAAARASLLATSTMFNIRVAPGRPPCDGGGVIGGGPNPVKRFLTEK